MIQLRNLFSEYNAILKEMILYIIAGSAKDYDVLFR